MSFAGHLFLLVVRGRRILNEPVTDFPALGQDVQTKFPLPVLLPTSLEDSSLFQRPAASQQEVVSVTSAGSITIRFLPSRVDLSLAFPL